MGILVHEGVTHPCTGEALTNVYMSIGTDNQIDLQKEGDDDYKVTIYVKINKSQADANAGMSAFRREHMELHLTKAQLDTSNLYALGYAELKTRYPNYTDA